MPTFIGPAPNVVQCEMHGLMGASGSTSRNSISVWHYIRTTPGSAFSQANVEAAFQASIGIAVTNALNVRYVQTFNVVRNICDPTQLGTQVTRAVAGQIAGDSMVATDAAFLLFRTSLRGKSYRGAKHLFPMSEADTTLAASDVWNATAITHLTAIITAYLTPLVDSDGNHWSPAIYSRKLSKPTATPAQIVANLISTGLLNKRVGDMKRRKVESVY